MRRSGGVVLALLGGALLLCALLLAPVPRDLNTPVIRFAFNLLHAPLYAGVFLAARRILGVHVRSPEPAAAALGVVLAVLTEVLQGLTSREASTTDLALNLLGIALAWWGLRSWRASRGRAAHAAVVLACVATGLGLLVREVKVRRALAALMPVIASFEHPWELERWDAKEGTTMARVRRAGGAGWALDVSCSAAATYPGVSAEDFDADWRGYRWLEWSMRLGSPEPMELSVRIDDDQGARFGDRYTTEVPIVASRERYRIDLREVAAHFRDHPMNMSDISELHFFLDEPRGPRTFTLDDVRLVRE